MFRVKLRQPARVFVVGGFEERRRFLRTDHGSGSQHRGRLAGASQPRGHFGLDGVDEQTAADGRARRNRRFQAIDLHHGIADGRAGVQDEIGEVLSFFPVGCWLRAGLGMFPADDGDHFDSRC